MLEEEGQDPKRDAGYINVVPLTKAKVKYLMQDNLMVPTSGQCLATYGWCNMFESNRRKQVKAVLPNF